MEIAEIPDYAWPRYLQHLRDAGYEVEIIADEDYVLPRQAEPPNPQQQLFDEEAT